MVVVDSKAMKREKNLGGERETEEIGKQDIHFWSRILETSMFMGLKTQE